MLIESSCNSKMDKNKFPDLNGILKVFGVNAVFKSSRNTLMKGGGL